MAGRPPKLRTLEEIEARLEPCALGFLYVPEEKARTEYLLKERGNILTQEKALQAPVFSALTQEKLWEVFSQIALNGQESEYFKQIQPETQEKILALEKEPTPQIYKLRNPIKSLVYPVQKFEDIARQGLNNIYNSTKYINCFYKWVLTEPQNGATNFYSCIMGHKYPEAITSLLKTDLILTLDMCIHLSKHTPAPKTQAEIFDYIKEQVLKRPNYLKFLVSKHESASDHWPFPQDKLSISKNLDIVDQIEKALEAVTLEDVTRRPSTSKEKGASLFTGMNVMQGAGHIPIVEEFSKLGERDAMKNALTSVKHYENQYSDMMLDMVKSDKLIGKEVLKDVLTDKIIRTTFHIGTQLEGKEFFRTGIIKLSKDEFMHFMGIDKEKAKEEATRRNFTKDLTEQLEMLINVSFVMRGGKGGGSGCHILDAYNTKGQEFYIRLGKEFVEVATHYGKIAWTPTSLQANRIPNRRKVEYFLQIKLENDFTSIYTQANERDTIKVNTLLNYLQEYGALNTVTSHYRKEVIERFIEALNYLQNQNKSIEYYFTTSPDKDTPAIEGPELEKYKTRADFKNLYLWYNIPELEKFRNEEDAKNRIAEKKARALASQARRERAKDKKLGELEAERIYNAQNKQDQTPEQEQIQGLDAEQLKILQGQSLADLFNAGK